MKLKTRTVAERGKERLLLHVIPDLSFERDGAGDNSANTMNGVEKGKEKRDRAAMYDPNSCLLIS